MMKFAIEVTVLVVLTQSISSQGILISGTKTIRANQNYSLAISNFNSSLDAIHLSIAIGTYCEENKSHFINESTIVSKNVHKMVHFLIPAHWSTGEYKLCINGENGFQFHRHTILTLCQSLHGIVQISKPVFQPGELVRFRVIVLDDELIPPVNIKTVQVTLTHHRNNKLKAWSEAPLTLGVFDGEFQLDAVPMLGTYNIIATTNGERIVSETFKVQEYVLPQIDFEVLLNSVPVFEDQGLNLTVSAKYPLGQPARGTLQLHVYMHGEVLDHTNTTPINGTANMLIRFPEYLYYNDDENVQVHMTFIEEHTNQTVTKTQQITVYRHRYYVTLVKNQERFNPHQAFECALKIHLRDGTPAENITALVQVEGISHDMERNMTSNNEGLIELSVLPTESTNTIDITVMIDGYDMLVQEIERSDSHAFSNGNEINFNVHTNSPIDSNQMEFKVVCSESMNIVLYYVVARGNIIESGRKDVNFKKQYTLELNQTYTRAPSVKVLVATVVNEKLLQDSVMIDFKQTLNTLKIQMDNQEVGPRQEIRLNVSSRPGAYAALLSIRKSESQYKNEMDLFSRNMVSKHAHFGMSQIETAEVFIIGIDEFVTDFKHSYTPMEKKLVSMLSLVKPHVSDVWLWESNVFDGTGTWTINTSAPDTSGFWHITGFSIHPQYGLELISNPVVLTTTKPFYIQELLPYAIKRGNSVNLPFILFNNVNRECLADVILSNTNGEFEVIGQRDSDSNFTKTVSVEPHVPTPLTILIKAKRLGEITVHIEASCRGSLYFDAVEKIIRVSPSSLVEKKTESLLFCRKDYFNETFSITLDIDKKADVGSQQIAFHINPNILETVAQNLGELLDVPSGNGEENMVKFVPNIVVLDYLTAIGSKDTSVMNIATKHLRPGYQNQMRYCQTDGSFGLWQNYGGSVFLTAFVAKSMQTASKYISEVDVTMVPSAFQWLATKQQYDGRFDEVGSVIHKDMQGGLRNGIALTSYVLIAFLENENAKVTHTKVIEKSVDYITRRLPQVTDIYDLSIATYAMMLSNQNHHLKQDFMKRLMDKSTVYGNGTFRYWNRHSHSIETTGYALLAMVQDGKFLDSVPVMRWLVSQRYVTGSIPRTQDTFVGLKALTKLAEVISPSRNDYFIQLEYKAQTKKFIVTSQDIVTQIFQDIPSDVKKIYISVAGMGFGLLDVKYEYATDLRNYKHRFDLTLEKLNTSLDYELKLKICVSFNPKHRNDRSNMALVEVNFPTGYIVDHNPITEATTVNPIQTIDVRFGGTSVMAYYASMGTEKNCFVTTAYRRFKVAVKRPAYVFVQDYYDPKLNAIMHYEVTP